MSTAPAGEITALLGSVNRHEPDALDRLLDLVYPALRGVAANLLKNERSDHTLQPTALVHEAIIKLFLQDEVPMKDRGHLMALAGRQMRRILIDYARNQIAIRRGGGQIRVQLNEKTDPATRDLESLLHLDRLLEELRQADPRAGQVVELLFFAGASREEVANSLGLNIRTVQRDWEFARAWLLDALTST